MLKKLTVPGLAIVAVAVGAPPAQAAAPAASQAGRPMVGMAPAQKVTLWRTLRKVVVCVAAIGAFVGGNGLLIWKLRKAGGVWRSAKRVLSTKGKAAKAKILTGIFGEVLGLDTIVEKC